MFHSPFFRRLFLPYLILLCAAVAGVGLFAAARLRSAYISGREQSLADEQKLVINLIRGDLTNEDYGGLQRRIREIGDSTGYRITVIDASGKVLAETWADPASMDDHLTRPEIAQALKSGAGQAIRYSDTVRDRLLYYAGRFEAPPGSTRILRFAVRIRELDRQLGVLYWGIALFVLLAIASAGMLAFLFARRSTEPLLELTAVAKALSKGQLGRRTTSGHSDELGDLGSAINSMGATLQDLLMQTAHDKAELLTILSTMSEGVIAASGTQQVLLVNTSAAELLGFDEHDAMGKPLWQIIRNDRILRATTEVLETRERKVIEAGVINGRHVEVSISSFPLDAPRQGMVIVAHDTTQSVRYQELRKEFVANVSHELRTPLTVIKGFVETLLDGAVDEPAKSREYLSTIERHTNQLSNLVNDLLELSKLESQVEAPRRVSVDLAAVSRKAIDLLAPAAQRKRHTLTTDIQRVPLVAGNPDYLDRAINNLLDNAIKYTPDGGKIHLATRENGSCVIVEVTDTGIGIPPEDLARIFERFYRVDRSRSREMGGTGLGLSIVKHIAQAHGGTVEVTSTVGEGSTFRLKLPISVSLRDE